MAPRSSRAFEVVRSRVLRELFQSPLCRRCLGRVQTLLQVEQRTSSTMGATLKNTSMQLGTTLSRTLELLPPMVVLAIRCSMSSYYRQCRNCGRRINLRQMPHGQWVPFERDKQHVCEQAPTRNTTPPTDLRKPLENSQCTPFEPLYPSVPDNDPPADPRPAPSPSSPPRGSVPPYASSTANYRRSDTKACAVPNATDKYQAAAAG